MDETKLTKRRPWLAALLSVPLAGLGHLYAGAPRRALAFYGIEAAVAGAGLVLLLSGVAAPWNVFVPILFAFGWRVYTAVDAFRYASKASACVGRPAWIRWPVYALVYALGLFGPAFLTREVAVEAFHIPTRSMADTLQPGDRFVATRWGSGAPERGELVVFLTPNGEKFVKRVVGLPGDNVEVREGMAYINGKQLAEPYVLREGSDPGRFRSVHVPAGRYFLLGDNRYRSKDSRVGEIGFVAEDRIVGRARAIFWSRDPYTGSMRWDRVGRTLR